MSSEVVGQMRAARVAVALATAVCVAALSGPAYAAAAPGPVALDDAVSAAQDTTAVTVDVLADDTLVGPATLAVVTGGEPQHGTVALTTVTAGDETRPAFTVTLDTGWFGVDAFRYSVTDASGLTAQATVTVTVLPDPPLAVDDVATVAPGASVQIAVLDNDSDPYSGRLTVAAVMAPAHGTADIVDSGRAITYSPVLGWSGDDVFDYTVHAASGATATARVTVTTLSSTPGHTIDLAVPASVPVLHRVTLTGAVTPVDGVVPTVSVQVRIGVVWTTIGTPVPNSSGAFGVRWTPTAPGRVALRAVAQWADGSLAQSAATPLTIAAVVDAAVSGPLARTEVPWSYRGGCPVAPAALRRLSVNYYDYSGVIRRGDIILVARAVPAVQAVLSAAFAARFPFKRIIPSDAFYSNGRYSPAASDVRAMDAGATSAFNCRKVTGNPKRVSQHSYGNAIDVNTFENPYATISRIYPVAAAHRYYVYRRNHLHDPGVIYPGSVVAKAFVAQRWAWGARWAHHDYQHFSQNGG